MTNKIYEYKDDQDWYVGSYAIFGGVRTLTDEDLDFPLVGLAKIFRDEERGFPISVTVLRYGSRYRLLSFVVDILNQEAGRNLEVIQRQGALLLVENGQLLYVELPKDFEMRIEVFLFLLLFYAMVLSTVYCLLW